MKTNKIPDTNLDFKYGGSGIFFYGCIQDGCLKMTSEVWGEDYDSEQHYIFSLEDTNKLFSKMSIEEFAKECESGPSHMLFVVTQLGITPEVWTI